MIAYIYSTNSNEIICEIHGISNDAVENRAMELGYMGCDEYGLTYNQGQMAFALGHDYQIVGEF